MMHMLRATMCEHNKQKLLQLLVCCVLCGKAKPQLVPPPSLLLCKHKQHPSYQAHAHRHQIQRLHWFIEEPHADRRHDHLW